MPTKIHISIPCLDNIKADTVASLLTWTQRTRLNYSLDIQQNTYVHYARNKAVWQAVNQKATHLMFIDSDMGFPADGVEKLLARNKDIIGGLYFGRLQPFPVVKVKHPKLNGLANPDSIPDTKDPMEVLAVGTGFMLINMDVFKKIDAPFFFHATPEQFGLDPMPFPHNEIGEDVAFCLKARSAGFKVWVDPSIQLTHIGEGRSTRETFDTWIAKEKENEREPSDKTHQVQ